jgi:thioesterase DpgC
MDTIVATPVASGDFAADSAAFSAYWRGKPAMQAAREARYAFLRRHARTLYDRLTDGRRKFVRLERLVYDAAASVPGLAPTKAEVDAESALKQSEKRGIEIDQGILCNQFLADPECGRHLCHAMLLPREEAAEALAKFRRDGKLDLGTAKVERHGKAAVLLLSNERFLNAEDNATQTATEIGADVCILEPHSQLPVLCGVVVPSGL